MHAAPLERTQVIVERIQARKTPYAQVASKSTASSEDVRIFVLLGESVLTVDILCI